MKLRWEIGQRVVFINRESITNGVGFLESYTFSFLGGNSIQEWQTLIKNKLLFSKANIFSPNSMSKFERCVVPLRSTICTSPHFNFNWPQSCQATLTNLYILTPKPTYSTFLYCSAVCVRLSYGFWSRSSGLVVHTSEKLILTPVQMRLIFPPC